MTKQFEEHSRLNKLFLEEGRGTLGEAEKFYGQLVLRVHLSEEEAQSPAAQAAALTAVLTAARCFRGGVFLTGATSAELVLPLPFKTVGEAALSFGASKPLKATCSIFVGHTFESISGWGVRAWWDSWRAGIRPNSDADPLGSGSNVLAGVAAGSLAVAQAFSHVNGDKRAGRIAQTISLWNPEDGNDPGESTVYLPKNIWLVGLGNLGQAYLWALALLPFKKPEVVELLLQDFDRVGRENWGTSVLTATDSYGKLKTRLAEDWALQRGFSVRRFDCRFDKNSVWNSGDPTCILSGLDSLEVRRLLGGPGISHVVDCGLGATASDFHFVRMNVFDQDRTAKVHFQGIDGDPKGNEVERILALPCVQDDLKKAPENACGMAQLAGASVAVPFVGTFAAALAVTQLIRIASNQRPISSLVLSVKCPEDLTCHTPLGEKPGGGIYSEAMYC